jgi:hypothetical protein
LRFPSLSLDSFVAQYLTREDGEETEDEDYPMQEEHACSSSLQEITNKLSLSSVSLSIE